MAPWQGLLGPILGRFFVDYGGRNAYASLMLAVSILSCKLGGLGRVWMTEDEPFTAVLFSNLIG